MTKHLNLVINIIVILLLLGNVILCSFVSNLLLTEVSPITWKEDFLIAVCIVTAVMSIIGILSSIKNAYYDFKTNLNQFN